MTGLRSAFFISDDLGWIVGGAGALLATTDGGRAWQLRRSPTEDTLWDVYFTDAATGWVLAERSIYKLRTKEEQRTYLLSTTDGGETWLRINIDGIDPDALLTRFVFPSKEVGYVFGESGLIFTTRDGGKTWAPRRAPVTRLIADGAFHTPDDGWIVGPGGTLAHTADGGESWNLYALPDALKRARLNAVTFVGARRGWIVGAEGLILDTTDGGKTWRAQKFPNGADLFDVQFISEREGWAAGANGTILRTTDGGARWTVERTDTPHPLARLAFAPRARRGCAVGFGGTILTYRPEQ